MGWGMREHDVLTVRGLRKRYRGRKGVQANDGIDLTVAPGQVIGLLGHNGAGKTTLVNQIVGLVRPDEGSIDVAGVDAIAHPERARALVSVQAQANVPITGLSPRRAIELVGRIRGGRRAAVRARTEQLLAELELTEWADVPAQKVSGGIARLTAFAMTVVQPGRLIILDEPTNDVDPVRRRILWDQIRRLADAGHGVLLVTHNVREAERVVDRLSILDHGIVLADDTPAGLAARRGGDLTIEVDLRSDTVPPWPPSIIAPTTMHGRWRATVHSADAAEVVRWAQQATADGVVERYALSPASLEDLYIELTTPADGELEVAAA